MASPRSSAKTRLQKGKIVEPRVHILKDGSLSAVAEYIKEGKAKNIIVMSGAGISTAAGIKDFRSPGTGLYDDLEKYNLPYPEAVFDISFFKDNPSPFFRLAKELLPGRYRPTFTHYLLPLLARKGLLLRSYTQNIDMLERLTGLDDELLVEAHGSFATSQCIKCEVVTDSKWVRKHILKSSIPYCETCGGLVKPTITFFGEDLPARFGRLALQDFKKCDLLIVLGTSLQVEPFNRLITRVGPECPRLLINREKAGEEMHGGFDFDDKWKYPTVRDAVFLGNCDDGVRELAKLCGWEGELQAMFEAGNIEMQIAEEMEALSLAAELEEAVAVANEAEKEAEEEAEEKAEKEAKKGARKEAKKEIEKETKREAKKEAVAVEPETKRPLQKKEEGKEKEGRQKETPAEKDVPSEDDVVQQLSERLLSTDLNAASETFTAADEILAVSTESVVVVTTIVDTKEAPKPAQV
ncbi:NAD+-dependent protein deacetylase sirtuin 2 [Entomortierella parvispora]|uniref:NAD+-dependent protein deacetylase sirtuin 2 n=1 Tax=Entomortierella parvispora TaxID=205924 RepID=A0A9P3LWX8_9FUNG|nr:NAD+-dependent protein deacetylase sirtuin 2 [Entomortierella parvispora]